MTTYIDNYGSDDWRANEEANANHPYRQELVKKFGLDLVDLAETLYETNFEKYFYLDLSEIEQLEYINKAKYSLEKIEAEKQMKLCFNKIPYGAMFKFHERSETFIRVDGIQNDVHSDFFVVCLDDGKCGHISQFGNVWTEENQDEYFLNGKFVVGK